MDLQADQDFRPQQSALSTQILTRQITLIVVGSLLLWIGYRINQAGAITINHENMYLSFAAYFTGFLMFGLSINVNWAGSRWASVGGGLALAFALVAAFYVQVTVANPNYGTDALALSHVAAEHLLQGENPYTLTGDLKGFVEPHGLAESFLTQTLDGGYIDRVVSYPSLHIVGFIPSLILGVDDLRWTILAFELASLMLLWTVAPWPLKILVLVPVLPNMDLFLYFTSGSVTDWLWVLPILGMTVMLGKGRNVPAALLYGVAISVKQQPWFFAPFLAVWVWHTWPGTPSEKFRALLVFGESTAAVFLIVNVPFILWDPGAWVSGVLYPLQEAMIPHGQGLSLVTQLGIVSLTKQWYLALSISLIGFLTLLYYLHFSSIKWGLYLFPMFVLFVGFRAYQSYMVYLVVVLVMALVVEWNEQHKETYT